LGLPVVSLPCGFSAAGLPICLSPAGRAFGEKWLLDIAHQYEQSTPWHEKRPVLSGQWCRIRSPAVMLAANGL